MSEDARGGDGMTGTQKIVLIALIALGAICAIVGFTLSHTIGGFIRHVEEEAREEEERREREAAELKNNHTDQEQSE